MNSTIFKIFSYLFTLVIGLGLGFAAGIYTLPILIAPDAPNDKTISSSNKTKRFAGEFSKDRIDSDRLHWGEGIFSINQDSISFMGELAPGPDYKLYLSPTYLETEADFFKHKESMVRVGDIKTFNNFLLPLATDIDAKQYNTVIIWCETFGEFITSGQYQ